MTLVLRIIDAILSDDPDALYAHITNTPDGSYDKFFDWPCLYPDNELRIPYDELRKGPPIPSLSVFFGATKCLDLLCALAFPLDRHDLAGRSIAHFAMMSGSIDVVRHLLQLGVAFNQPDTFRFTCESYATAYGSVDCLKWLLKEGLIGSGGVDQLHVAAERGFLDVIRFYYDLSRLRGAKNALSRSCLYGQTAIINYFINHGIDPKVDDFCLIVRSGSISALKMALEKKAYSAASLQKGLETAATYGHLDLALLLIKSGARCNHPGPERLTPILIALVNGHLGFAKFFIKAFQIEFELLLRSLCQAKRYRANCICELCQIYGIPPQNRKIFDPVVTSYLQRGSLSSVLDLIRHGVTIPDASPELYRLRRQELSRFPPKYTGPLLPLEYLAKFATPIHATQIPKFFERREILVAPEEPDFISPFALIAPGISGLWECCESLGFLLTKDDCRTFNLFYVCAKSHNILGLTRLLQLDPDLELVDPLRLFSMPDLRIFSSFDLGRDCLNAFLRDMRPETLQSLCEQPKIKSGAVRLCLAVAPDMLILIPGWQAVVGDLIDTPNYQIDLAALLSVGLDPNLRLPSGATLLHVCAATGRGDAIEMLIANGADKRAVDSKGRQPFDVLAPGPGCGNNPRIWQRVESVLARVTSTV